jgi:RNA polymerase sigma-70 factor (ECF subfamily)
MLMQKEAVKKTLLRTRHQVRDKQLYKQTNHVLLSGKRIGIILQVLYLMFNEGYKTTEDKELINNDLCFEAIRLCKLLLPLKPHAGEVNALLALMFFNIVRFPARLNDAGEIVLLQHQDRSKWNTAFINEGFVYLAHSRCGHELSRYHLEAGIAAIHCAAKNYDATDWQRIIFYYDQLMLIDQSPVIAIHRAIAVGESIGFEYGLRELERIETGNKLEGYYLFYASKAELLFKLARFSEATGLYEKALNHTMSAFNQQILKTRIQECYSHLKRHTNELFQ